MNPARHRSARILVVDDEQGLCAGLQEALLREGYIVEATTDASAALKLTEEAYTTWSFRISRCPASVAWSC